MSLTEMHFKTLQRAVETHNKPGYGYIWSYGAIASVASLTYYAACAEARDTLMAPYRHVFSFTENADRDAAEAALDACRSRAAAYTNAVTKAALARAEHCTAQRTRSIYDERCHGLDTETL